MADDGLREIQLNGKQLVFLFMASTVVAVVIFLCGVMVGRGVRTQATHELADAPEAIIADPTLPGVEPSTTVPAPPPPASTPNGTPSGSTEELTYSGRLLGAEPPDELKEPVSPGSRDRNLASALVESNPLAPVTTPRLAPGKADVKSAAGDTAVPSSAARGGDFAEPAGTGFVVQVAAVKSRTEANTIARRLSGKGYPAFVTAPGKGSPRMFRVRVGKYKDRKEVDSVAGRLRKEEQFKPWITR